MAGFDTPSDGAARPVADASTKLSLEGNDGKGKSSTAAQAAPGETGRGHSAHAGDEDAGMHRPFAPRVTGPTTMGIDVSEFQKTIDWTQVGPAGVKFAYIRATEGTTIQDANFVQNWQGAEKAGIPVGPYHYFTTASAVSTQIDNFVNETKLVDSGNLPPVLDVENPAQFKNFTTAQSVAMIQQWLDGVQAKTGIQPMLYMSSNFSAKVLGNAPQFDKYKLWVADYTTDPAPLVPKPWTGWDFWQHSDTGAVKGITGDVDLDTFNGAEQNLPVIKPVQPVAPVTPEAKP